MNLPKKLLTPSLFASVMLMPCFVWAADTPAVSPTGGVLKMVVGLAVVLAVMAAITWVLKRVVPGAGGQASVARVVGSVSVGSRERVVVVEVAGRLIVVGVAPGQVNGIANLDGASAELLANAAATSANTQANPNLGQFTQTFAPAFSEWLKKSSSKMTGKTDV